MSLFIISGLSGSGKSIALQALEDMGLYCIDNLPASLLPHFSRLIMDTNFPTITQAAVSIDARNKSFLNALPDSLDEIERIGIQSQIVYLGAQQPILVKRYKETRRKHPLTDKDTSLLEGIQMEEKLLEPVASRAVLRIDTTHTSPHQLRQQIYNFAKEIDSPGMTILFESFGFKHGTPIDADFVFDIRCLPNPHWHAELRKYTGLDEPVIRFLESHQDVDEMREHIYSFLTKWIPKFEAERRSYMTVAIGCTGGQHRSVYLVEKLSKNFKSRDLCTQIRHRELP